MKVKVLGPADVSLEYSVKWEEAVPTKVEHKVAQRDEEDRSGGAGGPRHAVIDTPGDDEQDGQDEEGDGQPTAPGDAVGEDDEAGAAGDGGNGDGQKVLLGLFEQDLVDGLAGQRVVGLPDGKAVQVPALLLDCRVSSRQC
jgi:hypothetical protein